MAVDRLAADRPATRLPARDDVVERLDAQVRERVRREGVDPQREADVVRRIAEDVVRDHDDLSLTGAVAPIADADATVGELVARISGFGPLQPFLDDPEVEEVWINSPERVFIARRGRHELTNLRLDADQVNELVERMLKSSGRRLDISTPFVDAMLPEGHRLHVVLEGITRGFTAVNIRKFLLRAHRLSDLVALGTLTPQAASFLEASVRAGLNVLVAGGTQAGKTTMLNCLAASVPGGERIVSAEEVFELRFSHPDWVAMQTRQAGLEQTGEIVLRDLVKEALRMRPSRILVGEVRADVDEEQAFARTYMLQLMDLEDVVELRKAVEARRDWEVSHALDMNLLEADEDPPPEIPVQRLREKYLAKHKLEASFPEGRLESKNGDTAVLLVQTAYHSTGQDGDETLMARVRSDVTALGFPDKYAPGMRVGFAADVATRKAIMGALSLYLSFINLFMLLLQLFGTSRE